MNRTERWIAAVLAAVFAWFVAVNFGILIRLFSPLPATLSEPTAGFVAGLLLVLPASIFVPQWNKVIALCLAAIATVLCVIILDLPFWSALLGCASGVAIVFWRGRKDRTRRSKVLGTFVFAAVFGAMLVTAVGIYRDTYARPEPLPPDLAQMLGDKANEIQAFYRYDRGGFIDHEWLWRIDGTPDAIAKLTEAMELEPAGTVPAQFWQMPPNYWPRAMPANGAAFKSQMFSADDRGPDGNHYFLVHDKAQGRAFVWEKANF